MEKTKKNIYVTQPSLPDLDKFKLALDTIWESKVITNNGDIHQQFEEELKTHLEVNHISLFNNGTIALLTALQALELKGEVITTPYSFIATANSILWNNLTPIFCDVDPIYGNIDSEKIESLITDKTAAILAVHVYGNPAEVTKIQKIANKHNLKVIYDAAHAFGVKINNNSILNYGDLSVLSFHATKVFNTVEGGAIISHSKEMKQKIDQLKNFGITDEVTVVLPGINGKMNEIIAAYGLLQLKTIDQNIESRKNISNKYTEYLKDVEGIRLHERSSSVVYNFSYYPIFIDEKVYGISRDKLYDRLKENDIYARRYFYPLISNFPSYTKYPSANRSTLLNANLLAKQVLCLPIYPDLDFQVVGNIIDIVSNKS